MDSGDNDTLVLGLGNVIMGDEASVCTFVRALTHHSLPQGVECLDGRTGGFILLEPLQLAGRIILIDATDAGQPVGTVTRTRPQFARDYPPTMTAHDIGVKDLLDAFYIQGGKRDVTLFTISIGPHQSISMELSQECRGAVDVAVWQILQEPVPAPAAA